MGVTSNVKQGMSNVGGIALVSLRNSSNQVSDVVVGIDSLVRQRSSVTELKVKFDGLVDIDQDAFEIVRRGAIGDVVSNSFTVSVDAQGNTIARITFNAMTGATFDLTRGLKNALVNGNYQLTIHSGKVRRTGTSVTLDGDGDGQAGGDKVFVLRRLISFSPYMMTHVACVLAEQHTSASFGKRLESMLGKRASTTLSTSTAMTRLDC